jgi:hypothetical protein
MPGLHNETGTCPPLRIPTVVSVDRRSESMPCEEATCDADRKAAGGSEALNGLRASGAASGFGLVVLRLEGAA